MPQHGSEMMGKLKSGELTITPAGHSAQDKPQEKIKSASPANVEERGEEEGAGGAGEMVKIKEEIVDEEYIEKPGGSTEGEATKAEPTDADMQAADMQSQDYADEDGAADMDSTPEGGNVRAPVDGGDGMHYCPICSKSFSARHVAVNHIQEEHTDIPRHLWKPCPMCNQHYKTQRKLMMHLRAAHNISATSVGQ